VYDYQCSSSFITYYAPAFVYLGIAASVVTPFAHAIGLHWYKHATSGTAWYKFLSWALPTVVLPLSSDGPGRHVFDANIHVISLITYLGILLTFGVVFPPVAVAMCATLLSVTWQMKLTLGRFLHFARETGSQAYVDTLDRDCRGAVSLAKLRGSLSIVLCFSCAFYALFVFDTLGNSVGLTHALWSLVVMPLFPVCIAAALLMHRRLMRGKDADIGLSVDENVFEMHTRRKGGSISSRISELSVNTVDFESSGGEREGGKSTGQDHNHQSQRAVFNVLTARAQQSPADEL
jgi:hypothetical protein